MSVSSKTSFTFSEFQDQVNSGLSLIIYDGKVYDVTKWKRHHPGGELTIRHVVGRDATDQILTNHAPEVLQKYLKLFYVGDMQDPSAESIEFNRPLSLRFRDLHAKISAAGLFETNPMFYVRLYSAILSYYLLAFVILWNFGHTFVGCCISGTFLALFWHQSASVMHDSGHNAVTHNRKIDTLVTILFTNAFTGFGAGWWKASHFLHHLMTNDPEHDPHIQLLPVIAISTRFFDSIYSTFYEKIFPYDAFAKVMVRIQHITYLPMMCLARFVVYKDGIAYLLMRRGYLWKTELLALAFYWCYFVAMITYLVPDASLKVFYFFLPNMLLVILQLQLFVSHNSMSTEPMGPREDFATYQLRTTLDYYCEPWMDWFNGGLQFQVAHHFFPRLPRHNLRRVTEDYVLKFIKDNNLEYNVMSFTGGNIKLLGHLKAIAQEAKLLAASAKDQVALCQKSTKARANHGN